jgi:hypothetical protein
MQLQIVKNVVVVVSLALLGTSVARSVKEEATAALRGATCIRTGYYWSATDQNCCPGLTCQFAYKVDGLPDEYICLPP